MNSIFRFWQKFFFSFFFSLWPDRVLEISFQKLIFTSQWQKMLIVVIWNADEMISSRIDTSRIQEEWYHLDQPKQSFIFLYLYVTKNTDEYEMLFTSNTTSYHIIGDKVEAISYFPRILLILLKAIFMLPKILKNIKCCPRGILHHYIWKIIVLIAQTISRIFQEFKLLLR